MYRRRTGRKRRRLFRRGYDRTAGFYGRYNKRRRFGRPEVKFFDHTVVDTSIATGGTNLTIANTGASVLSQTIVAMKGGSNEQERIGRKCTITKVYGRLTFISIDKSSASDISTGAIANHETIRVIVFWDKQCNGQAPANTDLLETNNIHSYRNLANSKRFKFLYDKTWVFNTGAIGAGGDTVVRSQNIHRNIYKTFALKVFVPLEFNGTTGALSELRSNNIGIMIFAEIGSRWRVSSKSTLRIRFIDK